VAVLNISNHFGCEQSTAAEVISVFFELPDRSILTKEFFESQILAKTENYEAVISECCKMVTQDIDSSNSDNLPLIKDLLAFCLRKETDMDSATSLNSFSLSQAKCTVVVQTLSLYLSKFLDIGGVSEIKMIDEEMSLKVSLAYYLSCLIHEKAAYESVELKYLKNLLTWLMDNLKTPE